MSPSFPIEPASLDAFGSLFEANGIEAPDPNDNNPENGREDRPPSALISNDHVSRRRESDEIAAAFDLVARVLMAPDASIARHFTAHLIADHLRADFVVIGQATQGSIPCEAKVISGSTLPATERRDEIEAALGETLATCRQHLVVPPRTPGGPDKAIPHSTLSSLAHRQLAQSLGGMRSLLSIPLINTGDQAVGVILVVWTPGRDTEAATDYQVRSGFLNHAAAPLSDCFSILDQSQPSRLQNAIEKVRQRLAAKNRSWLWIAAFALMLAGLWPVPYPVRANVTLQPKTRRFIASPIDAPLKKIHVYPGQHVHKGDLLLTLDAEQTHSQLNALQAEADRALSERSGFFASGRMGDAELARLTAARLIGEIEQLQQHLRWTEIRSPIDGVILGDDLDPLEGASLKTGQMLCEVAPLDQLIAELEIPPDQIMHISSGQYAAIKLEAIGRLGDFPIVRVHPRAEPNATGKYHFGARVEIANATNALKPGMQGVAIIKTDRHPLVWCLFHRLWQRIRTWS